MRERKLVINKNCAPELDLFDLIAEVNKHRKCNGDVSLWKNRTFLITVSSRPGKYKNAKCECLTSADLLQSHSQLSPKDQKMSATLNIGNCAMSHFSKNVYIWHSHWCVKVFYLSCWRNGLKMWILRHLCSCSVCPLDGNSGALSNSIHQIFGYTQGGLSHHI